MTDPTAPRVAAVVVTRGRPGYLDACVEAVRAQSDAPTLVLVDNGGGADVAAQLAPADEHVRFEVNRGCSAGFAAGIARAEAIGAELAWLLDDDCRPEPDALERLLEVADASPDAAAYEGAVINYAEGRRRRPARLRQSALEVLLRGPVARDEGPGPRLACFGNLLLRIARLDAIGPPEAALWVYCDDWELSMRLARRGESVVPASAAVCAHRYREPAPGWASGLADDPRAHAMRYYYYRNLLWMIRRHQPRLTWPTAAHLGARAALLGVLGGSRHLRAASRGIVDGWRGRLGPRTPSW